MVGKKNAGKPRFWAPEKEPKAKKTVPRTPTTKPPAKALAPRYSEAWKAAIRSSQMRAIGPWGASTITGDPESATLRYAWSRVLTRDSVCTEADFETSRLANMPTTNPCGYAVAIDITGYDEWSAPTGGSGSHVSYFRPSETQIYHIDMAHMKGRSLEHRLKWMACVPAIEKRSGTEYPVTIAPVEQTTYPDVHPSNTKNLSFGHTLKATDRRMTFYKRYTDPSATIARYRKYMVVGVYSPLSCNGASAGSDDVGFVDLTMQVRAFVEQTEMNAGYTKKALPSVIDYPIYDPAELEGPMGDDTSTLVNVVVSSTLNIKAGKTSGKYYAFVELPALDDVPRVGALYKLEKPIMINVATTSGGPGQPAALQYFVYDKMTDGETDPKGYFFASLHDAMECQPSSGFTTSTTITTTYPVRMIKEVDASGMATARGRGMGNMINVAHTGLTAPPLKRVLGSGQPGSHSGKHEFDLEHPSVIQPVAITVPHAGKQ